MGGKERNFYDKRNYFNFPIVNFPLICSNIPAAPAYGVYISQLIRYSRACGSYQDVLDRWLLLTRMLLYQGFLLVRFYFIKNSDLYNYADDNTLSYSDHDINKVISTLEDDSMTLINWFSINKMKANPEKFQAIAIR